jgi:hypothetical protein
VIHGDRPGHRARGDRAIERDADRVTGHTRGRLKERTLPIPLIDHGEHAKRPSVAQGVVDEVHAPPLAGADRRRRWAAMPRDVFPPTHPHPHLQAVQPIETADPLLIHRPSLAAQQDPDPVLARW